MKRLLIGLIVLALFFAGCKNPTGPGFVAVTGISGVPGTGTAGVDLTLSGKVTPSDATNKTIVWSVKAAGDTGATISDGNILNSTGAGTVTVTATIADGKAEVTDYTQDFEITIHPPAGERKTDTAGDIEFALRYVPGGTFKIDTGGVYEDGDIIDMTITKGYWMAETEVTQELWQEVMGNNPSYFSSNPAGVEVQGKRPVEMVSWYDAVEFCNKFSERMGKDKVYHISGITRDEDDLITSATVTADFSKNGYRLPTEMEWMWAAMGAQDSTNGYKKKFAGQDGTNSIDDYAWHRENSVDEADTENGYDGMKTHEVGKKTANELGLLDMSGNVAEWCWDWWGGEEPGYDAGIADERTDYDGPDSGFARMTRSGWLFLYADDMAVAFHIAGLPSYRTSISGLRFVRTTD